MVYISLINIMTFNVTLLQVNHIPTDTHDLYPNLPLSRQGSQTGVWKSWPHRAFRPTDVKMSLGKCNGHRLNFFFLLEAVSFIIQLQKEKDISAEDSESLYMLPTSFLSCTKQDQMFQQRNEASHPAFDLWDHPYVKCQLIVPRF